jgi:hypothetical protein
MSNLIVCLHIQCQVITPEIFVHKGRFIRYNIHTIILLQNASRVSRYSFEQLRSLGENQNISIAIPGLIR